MKTKLMDFGDHKYPLAYREGSSDEIVINEFIADNYSIHQHIQAGERWHDLGANIGLFSLAAHSEGATAIAYEPYPANYDVLVKNLQSYGITIHKQAVVGDATKALYIHHPVDPEAHWEVYLDDQKDPDGMIVPLLALRDIIRDGDCIKMDVEGAEKDLILLTPISCWQGVKKLIMEFHLDRLSLDDWEACKRHLTTAGLDVQAPALDEYEAYKTLAKPFIVYATR